MCTHKIIEIHEIEINKSFRLLVLFGNGYKASTQKNLCIFFIPQCMAAGIHGKWKHVLLCVEKMWYCNFTIDIQMCENVFYVGMGVLVKRRLYAVKLSFVHDLCLPYVVGTDLAV